MKAKIGNIEVEGTPEEIKEFVNSQQQGQQGVADTHLDFGLIKVAPADNIHTQISKEVNKDYD